MTELCWPCSRSARSGPTRGGVAWTGVAGTAEPIRLAGPAFPDARVYSVRERVLNAAVTGAPSTVRGAGIPRSQSTVAAVSTVRIP